MFSTILGWIFSTHQVQGDELLSTKIYGPYAYQPAYAATSKNSEGNIEELSNESQLYSDSSWPQRNASCFNLLNSFMER